MAISIHRCTLEDSNRQLLIPMFRRHLAPAYDERRFDWLYRNGPHGPALAWMAVDSTTKEIAGAAAAFPRNLYFNGEEKTGLVLGDFCMNENYRSLGPSLQLQRACVDAIREGAFEFFYDFPSAGMMAVYKRLGIAQTGSMVRWAKLLRAEAKLEPLVRSKALAKGAALVVDAALAMRGWKGEKGSCELELDHGPFGDEFTDLDEQLRMSPGIRTVRSATYLNWRYLQAPDASNQVLTARRGGTLVGYVVYANEAGDGQIIDLNAIEDAAVIARLLSGAVQNLAAAAVATVSLNAIDSHPWSAIFERAGFQKRDETPAVVSCRPGSTLSSADFQSKWFAMRGERDS